MHNLYENWQHPWSRICNAIRYTTFLVLSSKMQIFFCFNTKIQELIFFGTYNIDFSNILLNPKNFMFASQRVS